MQHKQQWPNVIAVCVTMISSALEQTASATDLRMFLSGTPTIVYDSAHDGCEPNDIPDMNPRAFRDASGGVVMFALHFTNRPLHGPDLNHLKIDCHMSLASPFDPQPEHYADRYWIASTWTGDGNTVSALIHHEYHAEDHNRCSEKTILACWYNTILAFGSSDGGRSFTKVHPLVVASAPFPQDIGQGRHRGFFEPSNMFSDGKYVYAFVSTTGWDGQEAGSCLFRSGDPSNPALWRAFDGTHFSVVYHDPYASNDGVKPCKVIIPFYYSVGSVVRHRPSGSWIAVFSPGAGYHYDVTGFYYATSRDLIHWSSAHLLLAGPNLGSDLCKSGPMIASYPSLLDPASPSRNFDSVDDHPFFYFVRMQIEGCQTTRRLLLRQNVDLTAITDGSIGGKP